jgi:hypothetical protein
LIDYSFLFTGVWSDFDRRVRKILAFAEVSPTADATSCVPAGRLTPMRAAA